MRKMWFGLLAIAAAASVQSVGCGGTGESTGSTGTGGAAATSSTSASTASSSASGTGGAGGGGVTSATSSAATTASSSASASGTGGAGGCTTANDCPMIDTECVTATCTQGVCGLANVPDQTPTNSQSAGDCKKTVCDGQGSVAAVDDDNDIPDDNKQCTADKCSAGVASSVALATGTACAEGNGKLCDGAGKCVECLADADCASGLCTANVCTTINGCGPAATPLTGAMVTSVNFGGGFGFAYSPKCLKVKVGTKVTFDGGVVGAFSSHPLVGGEVKNGAKIQAVSGPFLPITNDPAISSKAFTLSTAGTFPYYCDAHALGGMTGVVFVVP